MSFSHLSTVTGIPKSALIKEDFLLCYKDLDQITSKSELVESNSENSAEANSPEAIGPIVNQVNNIVKVFNQNIKHINDELKRYKPLQIPSFEDYCQMQGSDTSSIKLRDEYDHNKSLKEFKENKVIEEISQLEQIGYFSHSLRSKIEGVITRLKDIPSIGDRICSDPLQQFDGRQVTYGFFAPSLRVVDAPKSKQPDFPYAFITRSTVKVEEVEDPSNSQQPKAIQQPTAINEPQQVAPLPATPLSSRPSNVDVAVICDIGEGNTLGICHDPSWGDKPIAFTKNEQGWSGQVPAGKDWKFIVIQDEKIIKWEAGANRRCEAKMDAFTVKALELKFQ